MANILLVDDDVASIAVLKKYIEEAGHTVTAVFDAKSALDKIRHFKYDIVITDFNMPDVNGIELTEEILKIEEDSVVILVTAFASVKSVVDAMRKGAFDYLSKPINKDELILSVSRGLERINLLNENILLRQKIKNTEKKDAGYDTSSPELKTLIAEAKKVAATDSSVLITGENGTGKEVFAKFIHNNSSRKDKQFVILNCAAIPALLLESELFGHTKGSFTGAVKDHKGYFEIANNGTIFLDEIGELDTMLQVKLLRVIQEKEFSRVGDTRILSTDVRIITATNKDLKQAILTGKFREDLYYRLNVFEFHLPALKNRREDIKYYFDKFISEFAYLHKKNITGVDDEVYRLLNKYNWPGNIRELRNIAERIAVLADSSIITVDLLPQTILSVSGESYADMNDYKTVKELVLHKFEMDFLERQLKIHKGNVSAVAKSINFHPVSLRQKMSKLGLNPSKYKNPEN
jgi:DNA-binding NtrC family response regulator